MVFSATGLQRIPGVASGAHLTFRGRVSAPSGSAWLTMQVSHRGRALSLIPLSTSRRRSLAVVGCLAYLSVHSAICNVSQSGRVNSERGVMGSVADPQIARRVTAHWLKEGAHGGKEEREGQGD